MTTFREWLENKESDVKLEEAKFSENKDIEKAVSSIISVGTILKNSTDAQLQSIEVQLMEIYKIIKKHEKSITDLL